MELEDLYRLLRIGHVQVQGIVDTLDVPLLVLDQSLCVINANPAFFRTFHVDRDATFGVSLFSLGNGQWDIAELRRLLGDVIPKSQAVLGFEVSHDFPSIGRRTVLVTARRLVHPDDNSTSLLVMFEDVTDTRRAAAENDLLLAEMSHRIKNMLAVVHSIAFQTLVEGRSAKEYRDVFLGRLDAFLSVKDLVEQSGEEGVDIATLVDDALRSVASKQLEVEPGPSVRLHRAHVRPIRMVLHELTTNAIKYGALSSPDGMVHLKWSLLDEGEESVLELDWREKNGPPTTRPDRTGFGISLIEHSAVTCGGRAAMCFEPAGLCVRIRIPMARQRTEASGLAASGASGARRRGAQ
jgi:two-component sensor histidine kinase